MHQSQLVTRKRYGSAFLFHHYSPYNFGGPVMNQKWQGVSSYQYFHYYFWLDFASASLADITQKAMLKCTKVQKVQNWAKCRQLGEGRGEKMKIEEYTFSWEGEGES